MAKKSVAAKQPFDPTPPTRPGDEIALQTDALRQMAHYLDLIEEHLAEIASAVTASAKKHKV